MSLENPTFLEKRPAWQKVGAVILIVAASYAFVFWLGTKKAREWADSEYLQDREAREKVIAQHEFNEKKMAAENEKLRIENESKAEILRETDTANDAKKAEEFQRLQDERKKKSDEIENATPGESVAGLCDDAKAAGIKLSFCQ